MTSGSTVVGDARRALGPIGAFLPVPTTSAPPVDLQRDAVRRLERVGYRAAWTNETVGGKDALVQLAVLMAATERMVFGTGIANIWARAPQTAHAAAALLAQAYPGRFVLGLGVGYPEQAASVGRDFGSPVATMREYLDRMGTPAQLPAPDVAYPRIIGANGPKMLALAGELTDGALPASKPPEFTAQARQALGPDKLLVIFMHATIEQDDASAIMARVREHLAAGADHVLLGQPIGTDFTAGVDHLEQLAPALAELA
ncbi:MAG: LLM class flavin-dependent oxidoreductase [Streptosporangiaceae bacterium]